jgi:endonuclease G
MTFEDFNAWLVRCVLLILLGMGFSVAFSKVVHGQGASNCPVHYFNGTPPSLRNPAMMVRTVELCSRGHAVLHSGLSKGPLYAAEHLTADSVSRAKTIDRVDNFREDHRLQHIDRSEVQDFVGSGYDRGHLAPAGDMPDPKAKDESFLLSNIVPQNPDNNRGLWRTIETMTRNLAIQDGELYVVSGSLFIGENLKAIGRNVFVPSLLFKAVYSPSKRWASVYVVRNEPGETFTMMGSAEFAKTYGIDPFPVLPVDVRSAMLD